MANCVTTNPTTSHTRLSFSTPARRKNSRPTAINLPTASDRNAAGLTVLLDLGTVRRGRCQQSHPVLDEYVQHRVEHGSQREPADNTQGGPQVVTDQQEADGDGVRNHCRIHQSAQRRHDLDLLVGRHGKRDTAARFCFIEFSDRHLLFPRAVRRIQNAKQVQKTGGDADQRHDQRSPRGVAVNPMSIQPLADQETDHDAGRKNVIPAAMPDPIFAALSICV